MRPLVIAHRTCPLDQPENSLAGIADARRQRADVVEVDVRRTADGVLVLMHDAWLLRTTGWPVRLEWMSAARVARMGLRGGGTVPTLAEALAALGPSMKIAIDVKDPGVASAIVSEVRQHSMLQRALLWSQHETVVRVAAREAPQMEASLLRDTHSASELDRFLVDAARCGAGGISAHWSQITPQLAQRFRDSGMRLYSWCRTRIIDPSKLVLLDGLVTDWPAAGRTAVASLPEEGTETPPAHN